MANMTQKNIAYGFTNALQSLAQAPIVAKRAPTVNDFAEIGTIWVDTITSTSYIYTGALAGAGLWESFSNGPLSVNDFTPTSANAVFIYSGTGAPDLSLPKGSLYLRVDGSDTDDRAYIATDDAGTWTNIVTAA